MEASSAGGFRPFINPSVAATLLPGQIGKGRAVIRTGEEYCPGLRDGREVWIDGERVQDVTVHPAFKPVVDLKARMYDMAHEPAWAEIMSYREDNERFSILLRPPTEKAHWHEKWHAIDTAPGAREWLEK